MSFYWLTLAVLAVWRVTHLLHAEDGPWDVLAKFRGGLGAGVLGQMLDCFYCASVWIALPFAWAVGETPGERLLLWPALSGAAVLLQRATTPADLPKTSADIPASMVFFEDEEPTNVLRTESNDVLPVEVAHRREKFG
jgi:hypothetical protein